MPPKGDQWRAASESRRQHPEDQLNHSEQSGLSVPRRRLVGVLHHWLALSPKGGKVERGFRLVVTARFREDQRHRTSQGFPHPQSPGSGRRAQLRPEAHCDPGGDTQGQAHQPWWVGLGPPPGP